MGFILQLQGLQGLHWSTSVSQIIAVFLMTAVRGWVRRGSSPPVAEMVLDGCEMDWLALNLDTDDVATYFHGTRGDWEPRNRQLQDRTVAANSYNLAHLGDLRMATATDMGQTAGEQPDWETKVQQRVLRHRQRLRKLTNWVGPASKPALSVAGAIEAIINTLIPCTGAEFSWYLQFEMETEMSKSQNETESRNGTLDRTIKFTIRNMKQGGWAIDASEIEAALSLWIYSNKRRNLERERYMSENSDTTIEGTLKGGWLEYEKWKTQSIRVLGPNTEHLNRDLKRWIRNIDLDKSINPCHLVVGFIGLRSRVPVRSTFIIVVPRSVYLITYS